LRFAQGAEQGEKFLARKGLGQMVVEASSERTLFVVLSAPTGRGHQYGALAPFGPSNQPGHHITIKIRQADVSEASRVCRSRDYFSCISFVTDFTPATALATLTASLIFSRELTKPLN